MQVAVTGVGDGGVEEDLRRALIEGIIEESEDETLMDRYLDGEYILKLRLWRNTFDLMRGMEDPHDIEIAMEPAHARRAAMAASQGGIMLIG